MKHASPAKLFALSLFGLIFLFFQAIYLKNNPTPEPSTPLTGEEKVSVQPVVNAIPKMRANTVSNPLSNPFAGNRVAGAIAAPEERFMSLATPTQQAIRIIGPELKAFMDKVTDGEKDVARGVYVESILAVPILQQPADNPAFVSTEEDTVTQFRSAAQNGVMGLLAHNFLTGILFYKLNAGQEVDVVYGDGHLQRYRISGVYQYQKLQPNNLRSDLINLQTGKRETTNEVFSRFYAGKEHVTFQTCLERDGLSNWGLTFVVADPLFN